MTHTYQVSGMTCKGCEMTVKKSLSALPDVTDAVVSKDNGNAIISMSRHIPISELQSALGGDRYIISEGVPPLPVAAEPEVKVEGEESWLTTYKPLLILFGLITAVSCIASLQEGKVQPILWMNYFMAGFFLSFSFFKLINLKGFADSYAMYDIVARRIPAWGYAYAFIELGLGVAYSTNFQPVLTNTATLVVMSVSIIGVLQTVLKKQQIQCACLGVVFNLPMSTVTVLEDALMILMSAAMLWHLL